MNDPAHVRKTLGNNLYQLRQIRKKTVTAVAKAAGIAPGTIVRLEKGEVDFHLLTLQKLCNYYNITMKKLLDEVLSEES